MRMICGQEEESVFVFVKKVLSFLTKIEATAQGQEPAAAAGFRNDFLSDQHQMNTGNKLLRPRSME
jgi:hypothetical protein